MSEERYTYAVARVRAKESTLLNKAALDQLLACKTSEDCLRALAERGWGSENTHTAEEMLKAETEKTWQFLNSVLPDAHTLDVFRLSADFHNLKAAIKQVCTEQETPNVFCEGGTIPAAQILAAVQEQRFESLPAALAVPGRQCFDILLHTRDAQLCDLALDKACLEAIAQKGRCEKNEALRLYAETTVACADIRIAVRCCKTKKSAELIRQSLAECSSISVPLLAKAAAESTEAIAAYLLTTAYADGVEALKTSLSAFECWCDSFLIRRLQPQRYNPFTIGPLAGYLLARESEIKSVRLILSAKRNGLAEQTIRERLRECYV